MMKSHIATEEEVKDIEVALEQGRREGIQEGIQELTMPLIILGGVDLVLILTLFLFSLTVCLIVIFRRRQLESGPLITDDSTL